MQLVDPPQCPACAWIDWGNAPAFVTVQVGDTLLTDAVDGPETPEEAARRLVLAHTGQTPPPLMMKDVKIQTDPPALFVNWVYKSM